MPIPADLSEVLRELAEKGRLVSLTIVRSEEGFQASYRRPNTTSYSVAVKPDPVDAILSAVHPGYGRSWREVVGDALGERLDALAGLEEEPELMEDIL